MASAYFKLEILKKKRSAAKILNSVCNESKSYIRDNEVKKCRICLQNGSIPIFNNESLGEYSEYIREIADIEISNGDDFPKYMCSTCLNQLQDAISFRKKAKASDLVLRQNLNFERNHERDEDVNLCEDIIDNNSVCNVEKYNAECTKSYKCQLCNMKFVNWKDWVVHKNSKQHKNIRIQCPICLGLLTSQLYEKHLARHQSVSHLICDVCGKLYRKDNLVRHLQLHSFDLPHQCQQCPYRGRFVESLKIHMRTHTGDKPFACNDCNLHFLTRSNLNRHMLTHKKERPFKCIECGRGFYIKRDLDVHFKADHTGIKDFGCTYCGNKYGTRKALMRHELRVHKRDKLAKGRMPLYLQPEYTK